MLGLDKTLLKRKLVDVNYEIKRRRMDGVDTKRCVMEKRSMKKHHAGPVNDRFFGLEKIFRLTGPSSSYRQSGCSPVN